MVNIYSLKGDVVGNMDLPDIFQTEYRPDLIQKAVVALESQERQPYGPMEGAGMASSADYFGRRKGAYRQTINRGMSRLPREKTGGGGLGKVRIVPQAVGGRKAHPPKIDKDWIKKINKKEYNLALKSAVAATQNKDYLEERGHLTEGLKDCPIIIVDDLEKTIVTKDVVATLKAVGLEKDLERAKEKKIRAGRGKMRGRKYKKKKSALIVVNSDQGILKGARNIPGVDVVTLEDLDIKLLAPGTHAGRLTVWTKSAIENINKIIQN